MTSFPIIFKNLTRPIVNNNNFIYLLKLKRIANMFTLKILRKVVTIIKFVLLTIYGRRP